MTAPIVTTPIKGGYYTSGCTWEAATATATAGLQVTRLKEGNDLLPGVSWEAVRQPKRRGATEVPAAAA